MTVLAHTEPDTADGVRSIVPRRSLPSGRAVVGALLITVAAIGTFVLAQGGDQTPTTRFLVVTGPVDAGDDVSTSDFEAVPIELPPQVAATALPTNALADGATALRTLRPGTLVTNGDLLPATAGTPPQPVHELTIPVSKSRIGAGIVTGDRVTVLATIRSPDSSRTVVAVEDAEVLRWVAGDEGIASAATGVLTLALENPEQVLALTHVLDQGDTTVVRTTRALSDEYPPHYPSNAAADGQSAVPNTGAGS